MVSMKWMALTSAIRGLGPRIWSLQGSIQTRRQVLRLALSGAFLLAIILFAFLGIATPTSRENIYLHSGRRYSPEDLSKIGRALDRQRIAHQVDDDRRISVPSQKREQAEEILAKLELGPRLPGELRDQSATSSFWEPLRDKELREQQDRAKILQIMINDLPGIIDSFVSVNRPRGRLGLQPVSKPSAFVRLATDGDRQLPFGIVQSITTILTGYEEGLTADAVTVVDRRGHKYLVAGNPELNALSSNRAMEEELSQEILEQLDWIKGVRVTVQMPGGSPQASSPSTTASPTAAVSKDPNPSIPRLEPTPVQVPKSTSNAVALNRTLSLDPEVPSPQPSEPSPVASTDTTPPVTAPTNVEPGRVWVRVPRSYYYQVSLLPGHKEPPREELIKLTARTEELVKTGVGLVVRLAGPAAWKITIDIIQDEMPLGETADLATSSESGRRSVTWAIAGILIVVASTVAVVFWALLARRPATRGEANPRKLRFHARTENSPGPSERVREFVRRNPEAAASVLERWTNQKGDLS